MVSHGGGISEDRPHIRFAEIGKVTSDLGRGRTAGEHLEHVGDTNARSGNNRPPAANLRVDGDPGKACDFHGPRLNDSTAWVKRGSAGRAKPPDEKAANARRSR